MLNTDRMDSGRGDEKSFEGLGKQMPSLWHVRGISVAAGIVVYETLWDPGPADLHKPQVASSNNKYSCDTS